MSDGIVDLTAERNKRTRPGAEHVRKDDYGRELYRFLLSYEHDGGHWSTDMWAYDFADAESKVSSMRKSLKVDGQCFSTITA
jgi:hypothetical protein